MSFNNCCNALAIYGNNLTRCQNHTSQEYCETHMHRYRLEIPDECIICCDTISRETETPLECGHWLHKQCIIPTNLHKCPICQNPLTQNEIDYIFGESHEEQNIYDDGRSIYFNLQEYEREINETSVPYPEASQTLVPETMSDPIDLSNITNEIISERLAEYHESGHLRDILTHSFTHMNIDPDNLNFYIQPNEIACIPEEETDRMIENTRVNIDEILSVFDFDEEKKSRVNQFIVDSMMNVTSCKMICIMHFNILKEYQLNFRYSGYFVLLSSFFRDIVNNLITRFEIETFRAAYREQEQEQEQEQEFIE